jgi:hypothetical protein
MAKCRLCLRETILRKPHIFSEFLFKDLYNTKGHMLELMVTVTKDGNHYSRALRSTCFAKVAINI